MTVCYIGLGSNLGDRQYYIDAAVRKVRALSNTRVRRLSQVIESEPQGGPPQGMYLNAVLEIETELGPYELLRELQAIEAGLGRVRTVANAPRTIDLDILTYGDFSIEEEALRIPHPRILERKFVLVPLAQIAPAALIRSLKRHKQVNRKPARSKGGRSKQRRALSRKR
jgi:2-amino-4-hydroxy-6-hydroxymethyldihydropteridine diphosphokinase